MRTRGIEPGDLVLVNKRGRVFHARVRAVDHVEGVLRVDPLERNIFYRDASAREIADHWRHAGRPRDEGRQPPEQLDLNEWIVS